MAIIALAAPVSGIRGKVGGNVYSANKSGPYLKSWGRGSNPRTQSQTNHRSDLIQFAQAWSAITPAQRTAWDVYAALPAQDKTNSLGETYSASGFNWFIELNLNRRANGQGQLSAAPVLGTPATPLGNIVNCFATSGAGITNILVPIGDPSIEQITCIKAVLLNSIGVDSFSPIRPFMICQTGAPGQRNYGFKTELLTAFGEAQVGQKCFASLQIQNSEGRRGTLVADSDDVRP